MRGGQRRRPHALAVVVTGDEHQRRSAVGKAQFGDAYGRAVAVGRAGHHPILTRLGGGSGGGEHGRGTHSLYLALYGVGPQSRQQVAVGRIVDAIGDAQQRDHQHQHPEPSRDPTGYRRPGIVAPRRKRSSTLRAEATVGIVLPPTFRALDSRGPCHRTLPLILELQTAIRRPMSRPPIPGFPRAPQNMPPRPARERPSTRAQTKSSRWEGLPTTACGAPVVSRTVYLWYLPARRPGRRPAFTRAGRPPVTG